MAKETLFPDPEHPLATSDERVKQQVVKRIKERMKAVRTGKPHHTSIIVGDVTLEGDGHARKVSQEEIAPLWDVQRSTVSKRIADPGKMDEYECLTLCAKLRVTLEWLQYGEDYDGILNEQQVMTLYGALDPKDKVVISDVLRKFAGDEAVRTMELDERRARKRVYEAIEAMKKDELLSYLKQHPENRKRFNDDIRKVGDHIMNAVDWGKLLEKMQADAEECERLRDRLLKAGMDADELDGMTLDELREVGNC